jgi:hypothetical protein
MWRGRDRREERWFGVFDKLFNGTTHYLTANCSTELDRTVQRNYTTFDSELFNGTTQYLTENCSTELHNI